jgi:hypothetical protein
MWQSYVVKRQTICYRETGLQSGDTTANAGIIQRKALERFERRWLWHGTNLEVMDKIMQQGFNRSFCGKNATVYGRGVYFARDTSYSVYPSYSVPDTGGCQYIMACRVVVGEYCQGTSDALCPDVRDLTTQSLYDTTVGLLSGDTLTDPSIYVTYHDAQAYPEVSMIFGLKSFSSRLLVLTDLLLVLSVLDQIPTQRFEKRFVMRAVSLFLFKQRLQKIEFLGADFYFLQCSGLTEKPSH